MNQEAPVLNAGDYKQELQPIQSMEALIDQLVIRIQGIGDGYLERIHSAATGFMDRVDQNLGSTPSSSGQSNVPPEIKDAENAFDGQMVDAAENMRDEREILRREIKNLKRRWDREVFEKIILTETLVLNEEARIQRMIDEPTLESGELGCLMRAYARHREMKAYLQGLKFRF